MPVENGELVIAGETFISLAGLADQLGAAKKTLQNLPAEDLPPSIRLPGRRGAFYRLEDVKEWLRNRARVAGYSRPERSEARPRPAARDKPGPEPATESLVVPEGFDFFLTRGAPPSGFAGQRVAVHRGERTTDPFYGFLRAVLAASPATSWDWKRVQELQAEYRQWYYATYHQGPD